MEEKQKALEELPAEPRQGSGSLLARARKQQNKSIEQIAEELNLSVSQIRTIELDQTDGLPEPTYVRGYIRAYAKLLGLEPEVVLQNYLNEDWQKFTNLNDMPRGIGSAERGSKKWFSVGKLVLLGLIALIAVALWYGGVFDSIVGQPQQDQAALDVGSSNAQASLVVAADSSRGDEVSPTTDGAALAEPERGSAAEAEVSVAQESESEADIPQSSDVAQEDSDGPQEGESSLDENVLLMNFSETSWVDIRDADDTRLAYKSYAAGERLEVREAGELRVFIGNAAGVSVQLNQADFDISQYREGVYAKFVLPGVE